MAFVDAPRDVRDATSKTDFARSTPICVVFMWTPSPFCGLRGRSWLLARWCRLGEESIPSLQAWGGHVAGQGSAGNVLAALCSLFVPGLGQLLQGRLFMAIIQFVLAGVLWFFLLGWLIHLWSILDAALWKPKQEPAS